MASQREVGRDLRPDRRARRASTARRWSSSTRGGWPSAWRTTWASGSARTRSPRTTAACRAQLRLDAEQRLKTGELQRGGRDRVARARHRHRRGRSGAARSARRARSRSRCSASAAPATAVGAHAEGAALRRSRATSWSSAPRWCAAIRARRARRASRCRDAPLDILAQQIVAACACRGLRTRTSSSRWCAAPAPYATLAARRLRRRARDARPRASPPAAAARGALPAPRRASTGACAGRRGARLAAHHLRRRDPRQRATTTSSPSPKATPVGTLDEDFAVESMAGDIFLLGNTSWRIRRVEAGRVRVEDAHGAPPTIRSGSARRPARTRELSARGRRAARRDRRARCRRRRRGARRWLVERVRARPRGAAQLVATTCAAGARGARRACRRRRRVVAERFFDEAGGMQLVIHAPFGARINRAWGLALRKRFCRTFDFELQAAATDDGIVLSLGAQHSFPLEIDLRASCTPTTRRRGARRRRCSQAPMFATRWRWNATRALAVLRSQRRQEGAAAASSACAPTTCWPPSSRRRPPARRTTAAARSSIPDHPLVQRDHARLPARGDGPRRAASACSSDIARRRDPDASRATRPSRRRSRTRS